MTPPNTKVSNPADGHLMKTMTITNEQLNTLRATLISARAAYCHMQCEHGGDGMKTPDPDIKAAMEMLGMRWEADLMEIFHGDEWDGNQHLKPHA